MDIDTNIRVLGFVFLRNWGTLKIGSNVTISSSLRANPIGGQERTIIVVQKDGVLSIGNGTRIANSCLYARMQIIIGENVFIGGNCKIYDNDFHSLKLQERLLPGYVGTKSSPVHIGDGAFVGAHSIILKGVTIGENAIIAAGSVVTKNIPPNQIWGGNPAQFIRNLDTETSPK